MPIDPSIPLSAVGRAPAEPFNPLISLQQVAQIAHQRQALALAEQESAQRGELRALQVQEAQGTLETQAAQRAEREFTLKGREALAAAIKQFPGDHARIAQAVSERGYPTQAEAWLTLVANNQERLDKLEASGRTRRQHEIDVIGNLAATVETPEQFTAGIGLLATGEHPILTEAQARDILTKADELGPDGWKAIRDQYRPLTTTAQKQATEEFTLAPGAVRFRGGTQIASAPKEPPKPAPLQAKEYLLDGKPDIVYFRPDEPGQVFNAAGENVATRIKPMPAASSLRPPADPVAEKKRAQLVQAVLANPSLYDKLTPTVISEIAPDLAAAGFQGFGAPLPASATKALGETRAAIQSVRDLRGVLQANESYIGPLAGYQSLNPWSEGRKAQADIDRVRQRAGKALEGGVLRKEDEEKYKKILATMFDEPSTAIYKIDQMIDNLEKDLALYAQTYRESGRRVPASLGTAPTVERDAAGNVHTVGAGVKVGDVVKHKTLGNVRVTKVKPDGTYEGEVVP